MTQVGIDPARGRVFAQLESGKECKPTLSFTLSAAKPTATSSILRELAGASRRFAWQSESE